MFFIFVNILLWILYDYRHENCIWNVESNRANFLKIPVSQIVSVTYLTNFYWRVDKLDSRQHIIRYCQGQGQVQKIKTDKIDIKFMIPKRQSNIPSENPQRRDQKPSNTPYDLIFSVLIISEQDKSYFISKWRYNPAPPSWMLDVVNDE